MTLSREESSPPLRWKFSQVFGERCPGEEVQDIDIVSAIEFDKTGDYLAVGDRGGRVVIFERKDGKHTPRPSVYRNVLERFDSTVTQQPEYRYKTEFQSHEPEFDYLSSTEIEEKINKVRWCATPNGALFLLSTNDKTIKLWKIKEQKVKKVQNMDPNQVVSSENSLLAERSFMSGQDKRSVGNGLHLEWTENMNADTEDAVHTRCRKVYGHAHDFNINSISINSYLLVDIWISHSEIITSAEFHPIHCNLLAYGSSRGFIRLVDLRQSALCDHSARILQDGESRGSKSFFTEIIASISDIKFSRDGQHILSRDYMNLKLWDVRSGSSPIAVFKIHEHVQPKLCDLYNNDSIFDKFECCISGDGLHFATGSYSDVLRIFSHGIGSEEGITIQAGRNPKRPSQQAPPRARRSSLSNLTRGFYWQAHQNSSLCNEEISCDSKLSRLAWHPTTNLIACASTNSLFLYYV
ncbi:serine/threonine protein phosphatase 2A 55 kDa regulatory subunit B beta isoform-like isoform X2 [Tripterygium wilfordii]|uniref:serine/threonine protein phosphatase 2A 55 kDa regulatory subunit B beta isoform-like isoform X2 n=1 Tax=Tripterygium wilfordii TaxID=458696 RepID=UPI0018F837B5|nr:serine/threonine protein phosphatase 2A 55 kDa regulatory subunit B beta isoform-like isoform X2 [Tripterygium wilfordii]